MTIRNVASKISEKHVQEYRGQVLAWYDRNRRELPWRAGPGKKQDPYRVWLSEIMLQQTTVGAVIPYYNKFLEKWPEIQNLANADTAEVMKEWAGLGYYARARNLHKCAQIITSDHGGRFPESQAELLALPGIGDYTSAAITTIAFDKPAVVMDGNIERVMSRFFAEEAPLPKSKPRLKELSTLFFNSGNDRHGDLAQGLMDIGATICIAAGTPRCPQCPLMDGCLGRKLGVAHELPRKEAKSKTPKRYGHIFWIEDTKGRVLVHRRPPSGLLGGMPGFPGSAWLQRRKDLGDAMPPPDLSITGVKPVKGTIRHVFSHFDLTLLLFRAEMEGRMPRHAPYEWVVSSQLAEYGFPSLFQKALKAYSKS